jgi:hypothetical protein
MARRITSFMDVFVTVANVRRAVISSSVNRSAKCSFFAVLMAITPG